MISYSPRQYPFDIYGLLFRLGVTPCYRGFYETAHAVYLCVEHPEKLLMVTKDLYPSVAKQYHTTGDSVGRNIGTVIKYIWKTNPYLLVELAHRPLTKRPSTSQFIAILANQYLQTE